MKRFMLLASVIMLSLVVVSFAMASSTILHQYGACSGTTAYMGFYANHLRDYTQKIYWHGGYVRDIQLYITSRTGTVDTVTWIIYPDVGGVPSNPAAASGQMQLPALFPATVGTGEIGPLSQGSYWIAFVADVSVNGNYLIVSLSTSDCIANYGSIRTYDNTPEAGVANELRVNTYEDFITPTATFVSGGGTAMPTLTPTITLTPTPILSIISTLPSGSGYAIERTSTFGDGAIVLLLGLIAVLVIIQIMVQVFYANAKR